MFYDAVNMIRDVIRKANAFRYTAKFMFVGVKNDRTRSKLTNFVYIYIFSIYRTSS